MGRLVGQIVSEDAGFTRQVAGLLRSGPAPVSVTEDRTPHDGTPPDIIVVDGRADGPGSTASIERVRAAAPTAVIVVIAREATPDLILAAMRAGANEFLTWPPEGAAFHAVVRRTAARRDASPATGHAATTLAFFGAKGGAGTTTLAVNCGVEIARIGKRPVVIVDLKPGLGEVTLFLGVRNRYSLLDAIENLHRLDGEFLRELVVKHRSGLDILAGSDSFDRPAAIDAGAIEEVIRLLSRQYEYIVIDAGGSLNPCAVSALFGADGICLVANPDVACVRNAQRILERIGQLGVSGERIKVLLNRAAEPYPIAPAQIETALGHGIDHTFPSDYKTVSAAFNAGIPLTLGGNSELASRFDAFTRRILGPAAEVPLPSSVSRSTLGLQRIASLW